MNVRCENCQKEMDPVDAIEVDDDLEAGEVVYYCTACYERGLIDLTSVAVLFPAGYDWRPQC